MANLVRNTQVNQITLKVAGVQAPIFAAAKIYQGAMVALRTADGFAVRAGTVGTGPVIGVAQAEAAIPTASGNYSVNLLCGVFALNVSATTPPLAANLGQPVFAADDQTVSINPADGPMAGVLLGFEATSGLAIVGIDPGPDASDTLGLAFKARAVATSIGAYAGTGTGQLTANANGALATQDGVTIAAGDAIILPTGLSNVTAADAGPYVVTTPGTAGTKYVLTRPWWWKHGSPIRQGSVIEVGGEGTLFGSTSWKATCAGAQVVGTNDPLLFPGRVTQSIVLVAGTKTVSNVPIKSATATGVSLFRTTANTVASTVGYGSVTFTAGALGTASLVVNAQVAAGTINVADVSTLALTIINW